MELGGNPAEQFTDEEVPHELRHLFPSALRRAYLAADDTIDRHTYFQTPGGRYQRGDLIMLAASFEFELLVKSKSLPFVGSWEDFAKPTGKHYVMRSPKAIITISQVENPAKRPRRAIFRSNYAELNDMSLFDTPDDIARRRAESGRRLLHILHGYHDLNFVYLAYPHPERNRHVYRSRNLMQIPHQISGDLPPAEGPSDSPSPEALEGIERHLRDDDR